MRYWVSIQFVSEQIVHFCRQHYEENKSNRITKILYWKGHFIGYQKISNDLIYWSGSKVTPIFMKVGESNLGRFYTLFILQFSVFTLFPRIDTTRLKDKRPSASPFHFEIWIKLRWKYYVQMIQILTIFLSIHKTLV